MRSISSLLYSCGSQSYFLRSRAPSRSVRIDHSTSFASTSPCWLRKRFSVRASTWRPAKTPDFSWASER